MSRGHFLDKRNEQLSATEPAAGRSHDKKKTSAASHSYAKKHSGGDDHGGGGGGHDPGIGEELDEEIEEDM